MRRRFMVNDSDKINVANYLTIEALGDGLTVSLSKNACQYCIDADGDWKTLPADTKTPAINSGQRISFKGSNMSVDTSVGIGRFSVNKNFNLSGNCLSMIKGDNAALLNDLDENYQFYTLFYKCTTLINISKDFLPSTNLTTNCYRNMFTGCTALVTAPELPAIRLLSNCYRAMFFGCTSLVAAVILGETLASNCCHTMFNGCNSLNYIKAMFKGYMGSSYTYNWVYGVSSTGTFVRSKDGPIQSIGTDSIPTGWTQIKE